MSQMRWRTGAPITTSACATACASPRCSRGRTGVGPAPCAGIAPSSQDDDEPGPVPTLQDRAGDSRSSTSSSGRRADGSPPRPTTCSGLRDSHRPGNLPVPYVRTGGRAVEAPPRTRPAHRLGQRRGVAERMPNKWTPMLTWTQIESAAVAAGWKRAGVEWRGPCPFCGGRARPGTRPPGIVGGFYRLVPEVRRGRDRARSGARG